MKISLLLQLLLLLLPWGLRRSLLRRILGFNFAPGARIGKSLVLARRITLGENASIGHLTIVKGLFSLEMGSHARLGNLNWITGQDGVQGHFIEEKDRISLLKIGDHAAITHRHLIDCTNRVEIGRFSTFAGWRSQILTHAIDIRSARQRSEPVEIGEYCFVGTSCILLKGARLPSRSVLGAGSVLGKGITEELCLYSGNPARLVRKMEAGDEYFIRTYGFVQ